MAFETFDHHVSGIPSGTLRSFFEVSMAVPPPPPSLTGVDIHGVQIVVIIVVVVVVIVVVDIVDDIQDGADRDGGKGHELEGGDTAASTAVIVIVVPFTGSAFVFRTISPGVSTTR